MRLTFSIFNFPFSIRVSMQDDVGPDAEVVYPAFSIFNSPFSILSEWESGTSDVTFSDPNARTTLVNCVSFPSWDCLSLYVRADLGGCSLYSHLNASHGTNGFPLASFALTAPETVFLNDDDRTSRWYRVSLVFSCPVWTNAVFSLTHNGDSGLRFAEGPDGSCPLSWTQIQNGVSNLEQYRSLEFYIACSNIAEGTFTATCTLPSGAVMTSVRDYKVIEPLRKLVCTDPAPDGGIVNPSRLVYGANAWLHVDQNGSFNLGDVVWRVVSGPGEFASVDRNWACVRTTETTGVVVVEAAFGFDALIQPRFVLPVVEKKRIPVRVYYVKDSKGKAPKRMSSFDSDLELANEIYSQVGVEFYRVGDALSIADASYSILPEHEVVVGADEKRRSIPVVSDEAVALFNLLPLTNIELRVVYVGKIIQGTSLAFSVRDNRVVVMGEDGTEHVLAHELGHLLGMEDIYFARKDDPSVPMPGFDDVACARIFASRECDWGVDDGRAFYEISDSHGALIGQLLMCGFDDVGSGDIPDGSVCGYPPEPRNAFHKPYIEVGADTVRRNLR